jgi:hypothetical protein
MSLQTPLYNQVTGTILAAGTLTASPFDTQGYTISGLLATGNSVNGTLNFLVNDTADSNSGNWKTLYTGAGVAVAVTAPSGAWGISADALTPLRGYRHIWIKTTAQTTGLGLILTLKAE